MKKFIISALIIISVLIGAKALAKTYITGYDVDNNYKPVKVEKGVYVRGISLYPSASFGESIPNVVASFETSLAAKISSSATTMSLVSGTTDDGTTLSGLYGFVIDEGGSNQEFVLATCANTTCTGMTRGISTITGTSSVTALQKEHRRGASVKITDHPVLATLIRLLNGQGTLPAKLTYSNNLNIENSDASSTIPTKYYVDNVATSGAANATETVKGIIELATGAEAAAGTSAGATGARLALPASLATNTPSANVSIPVTEADGNLNANFIGQDQTYTWTGNNSYTGSSTFATTTFTINPQTTATPTADRDLTTKSYVDNQKTALRVDALASTTYPIYGAYLKLKTYTIPAGTMAATSTVRITVMGEKSGTTQTAQLGVRFGGATSTSFTIGNGAGTFCVTNLITNRGSLSSQYSSAVNYVTAAGASPMSASALSINTADAVEVDFYGMVPGSNDRIDMYSFLVEVLKP